MSTLTSKQISETYKQLLKVNVSADTNTGLTNDLQQIQSQCPPLAKRAHACCDARVRELRFHFGGLQKS